MSKHVSIAIEAAEIRGLGIASDSIVWHARAPMPDPDAFDEALRALLLSVPRELRRARATIVLSPRWVQAKQLHGLPPVRTPRIAAQLIRENQQAFFLWSGKPATVVARIGHDGTAWGAAFDTEIVEATIRAIRAAGLRVVEVAPSVAAIGAAFPGQRIHWRDAGHDFVIEASRDELVHLGRASESPAIDGPPLPGALESLGADAEALLAAYAAATLRRGLPLAWRPRADSARLRRRHRLTAMAACVAIMATSAAAALAPGLRAAESTRQSDRELARLRVVQRELVSTQSELRRVSDGLERVASFAIGRGRIARTLGELSEAIPESTAILELRIDSTEGAFTAIAPEVADVLPALAEVHDIAALQIIGSVTRETISGARLERAAFRFRRPRTTGHAR